MATVAGVMLAVIRRNTIPEPATVPNSATLPVVGVAPTAPAPTAAAVAAPAIGAVFGLAAALFYGVSGFMIGPYSRDLGWLVPVVIARSD